MESSPAQSYKKTTFRWKVELCNADVKETKKHRRVEHKGGTKERDERRREGKEERGEKRMGSGGRGEGQEENGERRERGGAYLSRWIVNE